jgi:hypothetical protein
MREPITLGELLENCRLQTSVQDTLVHRHWGIPNQVAEWRRHATPLERYQATLFCWLQHACQWMHPLFFENVANFSRPFLEELVKDRKSPARLGIVDFRWCLHLPQYHFFDLRTGLAIRRDVGLSLRLQSDLTTIEQEMLMRALKQASSEWVNDNVPRLGASVAFILCCRCRLSLL